MVKASGVRRIAKRWNAGELGCGPFIVGVRRQLDALEGGACLEITTRNEGAPTDLPAWCRMTGHELVAAEHPVYIVRKSSK